MIQNKVGWDNNTTAQTLNQSGDFFRPGGHYFAWTDRVNKTKCYLFGPVEDVHSIALFHSDHGGSPAYNTGVAQAWGNNTIVEKFLKGYHIA